MFLQALSAPVSYSPTSSHRFFVASNFISTCKEIHDAHASGGTVPGDFVCAGHGDELLSQQHAVPRLRCVVAPDGYGSFSRLDLCSEVPSVFSHYVLAAVHCTK